MFALLFLSQLETYILILDNLDPVILVSDGKLMLSLYSNEGLLMIKQ